MSDYFLADVRAGERKKQREPDHGPARKKQPEAKLAAEMKVTLLGDFLITSNEPQGCDPYNASNGRAVRDAWKNRRDRR